MTLLDYLKSKTMWAALAGGAFAVLTHPGNTAVLVQAIIGVFGAAGVRDAIANAGSATVSQAVAIASSTAPASK